MQYSSINPAMDVAAMSVTAHPDVPHATVCRPHSRHATARPVKGKSSQLQRCIEPVILNKVCFIAPSPITSKPGSPLATNLTGKATCTRQRLMSRLCFAAISNVASLHMVLLAPAATPAAMIL
jgi:hypothetical protein